MKYMIVIDLNDVGVIVIGIIKGGEWFLGILYKDILFKFGFYFLVSKFGGLFSNLCVFV